MNFENALLKKKKIWAFNVKKKKNKKKKMVFFGIKLVIGIREEYK